MLVWRFVVLFFFAILLSSCNTISSYRLSGMDSQTPKRNAGGSYFLAKHLLVATVSDQGIALKTEAVRDNSSLMQLALELSVAADDTIDITYENGLLKSISSTNDDKTTDIVLAVAEAAGFLRSGQQRSGASEFVVRFDPFDSASAIQANRILRKAFPGSCIEVELVPGHWSKGCGKKSLGYNSSSSQDGFDIVAAVPPKAPGVYYKRAFNHRVYSVFRDKPQGMGVQSFANLSPILRLDVDRTAFVKRVTTIEFAGGEPTKYKVEKPSELLAIAQLPVAVVKAYVGGVVSAFSEHTKIQQARANLLNAQAATLQKEKALFDARQVNAAAGVRQAADGSFFIDVAPRRRAVFSPAGLDPVPGQSNVRFENLPIIRDCREGSGLSSADCIGIIRAQNRLAEQ